MTDKQIYLHACKYAVYEMLGKGSSSLAINIHSDNPTLVEWKDVLKWIEKEYGEEDGKDDR